MKRQWLQSVLAGVLAFAMVFSMAADGVFALHSHAEDMEEPAEEVIAQTEPELPAVQETEAPEIPAETEEVPEEVEELPEVLAEHEEETAQEAPAEEAEDVSEAVTEEVSEEAAEESAEEAEEAEEPAEDSEEAEEAEETAEEEIPEETEETEPADYEIYIDMGIQSMYDEPIAPVDDLINAYLHGASTRQLSDHEKAMAALGEQPLALYKEFKTMIADIFAGRRTESFTTATLGPFVFTDADLGVSIDSDGQTAFDLAFAQAYAKVPSMDEIPDYFGLAAAAHCAIMDSPYEAFWARNGCTWGMGSRGYTRAGISGKTEIVIEVVCTLGIPVYDDFFDATKPNNDQVGDQRPLYADPAKVTRVENTRKNAQAIVDANAGFDEYTKLLNYAKEVCKLNTYNTAAANGSDRLYGDPWQIIYVFDNDPSTNVVCEGYSKAMLYLAELTQFKTIHVSTVWGTMNGGAHMWNLVRMDDGKNYLLDVTNMDQSTLSMDLFLTGSATVYNLGTSTWRYSIRALGKNISYQYAPEMLNYYTTEELTLASAKYAYCSHTPVAGTNGVPATCTAPGREADTICSKCKAVLAVGQEIPALGHDWSEANGICVRCEEHCPHTDADCMTVCGICGATVPHNMVDGVCGVCGLSGRVLVSVTSCLQGTSETVANVTGGGVYVIGSDATVTAPMVPGMVFVGWYQDGTKVSDALSYTFTVRGDTELTAVYKANASVAITIEGLNSAQFTVGESTTIQTSYMANVPIGTVLHLKAVEPERVSAWLNGSAKIISREATLDITVTGPMTLKLMYKASTPNQAMVEYVTDYGQILSYKSYSVTDPIQPPTGPSKLGFVFTGWDHDVDAIRAEIAAGVSHITVRPQYSSTNASYTVTVKYAGGLRANDVYSRIPEGEGKTITAKSVANKVFTYWTDVNGNILSYSQSYYIRVTGDVTLIANFAAAAVEAQPTIVMTGVTAGMTDGKYKLTFIATRDVPAGFRLVEHGLLYQTTGAAMSDEAMVIGGTNVKQVIGGDTEPTGTNALNLTISNVVNLNKTYYVRGYLILCDGATGELQTVYSDILSASYNALAK